MVTDGGERGTQGYDRNSLRHHGRKPFVPGLLHGLWMVDQRPHAATDRTPVAARLIRPRGRRARSADDRGICPGYAGHRRHRLAFHFSDTSAVLQRVGDPAGGSVRRGRLERIAAAQ